MSDIAILFKDLAGDFELIEGDLALDDDGLTTAVIISLFTDRRAAPDDPLPDDGDDRRGWWADAFPAIEGDAIGSKLWLLSREKEVPAVAQRAREYAAEALQWLIDDGLATRIDVDAYFVKGA